MAGASPPGKRSPPSNLGKERSRGEEAPPRDPWPIALLLLLLHIRPRNATPPSAGWALSPPFGEGGGERGFLVRRFPPPREAVSREGRQVSARVHEAHLGAPPSRQVKGAGNGPGIPDGLGGVSPAPKRSPLCAAPSPVLAQQKLPPKRLKDKSYRLAKNIFFTTCTNKLQGTYYAAAA